jgi:hypothetical protein
MANALRGEASFNHDDETLTVVFDTEAFLQFEDATGLGLFQIDQALAKLGLTAELLRIGLRDRDLTRAGAAEMILVNGDARTAVLDALDRALPDKKAADTDPPKAAGKSGTGKIS